MSRAVLSRGTLIIDEKLKSHATAAVESLGDEKITVLTAVTSTGRRVDVDSDVVDLIGKILSRVAQGGELSLRTMPKVLTTSAAASLLGVSRTTIMNLIRSGTLSSDLAGTHHRIRHEDVIKLKQEREQVRSEAIQKLLELEDTDR